MEPFNSTLLQLIPKKSRPKYPSKLQPIALCNMTYKIVAKLIANQLKPLLPSLIDVSQGGFVVGRGTMNDAIVVFKTIHSILRREPRITSSTNNLAIKINMSKAYDRMS